MKSILLVSTIEVTIRTFYSGFPSYFRERGYQIDAMANGVVASEDCRRCFGRVWDIDWTRSPRDVSRLIRSIRRVRHVVEEGGYDLVHVCTPIAAFITRLALRGARSSGRVKVGYTAHGFHFHGAGGWAENALFLSLEKVAGRWTDFLMVVNREDHEAVRRYRIVPPLAVRYVPGCGIDLRRFNRSMVSNSSVVELYRDLDIPPGGHCLLMIADLIPRKRPWDIIEAFAGLPRTDVYLLIAGGGPLLEPMGRLARRLGVADRIRFLGVRQDIPILIRASVCTLLASRQEGLSQCVQESLALATPVIATNIRGVRDLLAEGSGLLVEVGDVRGFRESMTWVLEHPADAQALGERGVQVVASCDLGSVLRIHEEVYASVLWHS